MQLGKEKIGLIIILTSFALGLATLTRGHEWGDDWASYVMQGQSILNGATQEFMARNAFTIFNSSFQIGPVAYPWGYPLLLTPALLFKGVHPLTLKLPGLLLFTGFLLFLYYWVKKRLPTTDSLLLIAVFAFNPVLLKFTDYILSDIPFLFAITLSLLLLLESENKQSTAWSLFLGATIFCTLFIRTTGLILLASFLIRAAIRFWFNIHQRKNIILHVVLAIAGFSLLWLLAFLFFPDGQSSYLEQLKGLNQETFLNNLRNYFFLFISFFGQEPIWVYTHFLLVALFFIGIWHRFQTDLVLIIFFAAYFTAMIFWPEWQGIRFIFPLLPIYIYFAFHGMRACIHWLPTTLQSITFWAGRGAWLALVIFFLFTSGTRAYTNLKNDRSINGPFDPFSSDVYNYIRANTPSDSVIIFYKPRAMRLFTDRNTLMVTECERLPLGDYVVISKKAENSQIPVDSIEKCNIVLQNVFENQRFIIYKTPK